jgi:hypothetical protein
VGGVPLQHRVPLSSRRTFSFENSKAYEKLLGKHSGLKNKDWKIIVNTRDDDDVVGREVKDLKVLTDNYGLYFKFYSKSHIYDYV